MAMVREVGSLERFPYLAGLGIDPEDAGRLDVAAGTADHAGFFVEAASGETRLLDEGEQIPDGVWIAQRDLDIVASGPGTREERHGFGEGWGTQGEQFGGDRSYPSEDAGGTRRVTHKVSIDANADPSAEG